MSEDVIGSEGVEVAEESFETPETVEASEPTVEPAAEEATVPDPWASLQEKGYDPAALEKSFTRFTQELESVKEQERELQPYVQLKQMLDEDPRILEALDRVLNEPLDGETEVDVLRRELTMLQTNLKTDKELSDLRKYASENELPSVDEKAVVQHAIKNNLGSLRAAYHDMNFQAIRDAERERTLNEVKGVKQAKAVTTTAGTKKGTPTFTEDQIAAMSSEEFIANRAAIFAYYDELRK